MEFRPTVKQDLMYEAFDDDITTELLFGGSAGSSKSYGICSLVLLKCLEFPGIRIGLARNELTTLKKTTVVSLMEVANDWGIENFFNYNSTGGIIKFDNGSEIILCELRFLPKDPSYTRLGGHLFTFGVIDEVGEVDEKGYNIFRTRLGRWKNKEFNIKPICIGTCNPIKNWLYRKFYKKHIDNTLEPYKMFIQALPTDNPYLPQSYLDNLQTLPTIDRERLLYGNWEYDESDDALISYENTLEVYNNIEENENDEMYISADIAMTSDNTVILIWKGLTIIDIIMNPSGNIEDFILEKAREYNIPNKNITWDNDGVGAFLEQRIRNGKPINNGGRPLLKENYKNLKTQLYYKLADLVNEYKVKCLDTSKKEMMIEELQQVRHKVSDKVGKIEMVGKDEVKRFLGRSPDISDAMAYRMIYEIKPKYISPFGKR